MKHPRTCGRKPVPSTVNAAAMKAALKKVLVARGDYATPREVVQADYRARQAAKSLGLRMERGGA